MKSAVCIVVALVAFSQATIDRPTTNDRERSRVDICLADLRSNLEQHVQELGNWGRAFILQVMITRQLLESNRELCYQLLRNDPPTFWERLLFDACITENDRLAERESERVRRELLEKAREQPGILGRFLVEFTRCIVGRIEAT